MNETYRNPIIPGMAPDPSICRKGDDYYICTSSFEWFPALPVYHSKDLVNWELISHCITDESKLDMHYIESAKGIWAPTMVYDEKNDRFILSLNNMHSMNSRFFDVDNFVMTAKDPRGPWSELHYVTSAGFDGAVFIDDDDRYYFPVMEWETRENYHKPGVISIFEIDRETFQPLERPHVITEGITHRGCVEGPHMYKRNGWYYLLTAEGGTGYGHAVILSRSRNIYGPYEASPYGPVITSTADFDEMDNDGSAKGERYNPDLRIQKAGHGSFVFTHTGEIYMSYLCGRPMLPELRCVRGRETSLVKIDETPDGWFVKHGGKDNWANDIVDLPAMPIGERRSRSCHYQIPSERFTLDFRTPRCSDGSFLSYDGDKVVLKGMESLSSTHIAAYKAHILTGLDDTFSVKMDYDSGSFHEYAGICIYYDQMDYAMLRKIWSDPHGRNILEIMILENGEKHMDASSVTVVPDGPLKLTLRVRGNETRFYYEAEDGVEHPIGEPIVTDHFSDEYCRAGEFTGTSVGFFAVDSLFKRQEARFSEISYEAGKDD